MYAFWGRSVIPALAAIVSAAGCTSAPQHAAAAATRATDTAPPAGYRALFNGKDLTGWKADAQAKRHWTVQGGVLDYDGQDRDLWTEEEFGDFVLTLEWRWSGRPVERDHPLIGPDGHEVKGPDGKVATRRVPDGGDSGIFLRGFRKAQVNLFCYPVGSGA